MDMVSNAFARTTKGSAALLLSICFSNKWSQGVYDFHHSLVNYVLLSNFSGKSAVKMSRFLSNM